MSVPDKADAQTHVSVATVRFEAFASHHQRDQSHVRTVHRLERYSVAAAFPRRFIDQFAKTFDDFGEDGTVQQTSLETIGVFNERWKGCLPRT